jgi:hypothetical protein
VAKSFVSFPRTDFFIVVYLKLTLRPKVMCLFRAFLFTTAGACSHVLTLTVYANFQPLTDRFNVLSSLRPSCTINIRIIQLSYCE